MDMQLKKVLQSLIIFCSGIKHVTRRTRSKRDIFAFCNTSSSCHSSRSNSMGSLINPSNPLTHLNCRSIRTAMKSCRFAPCATLCARKNEGRPVRVTKMKLTSVVRVRSFRKKEKPCGRRKKKCDVSCCFINQKTENGESLAQFAPFGPKSLLLTTTATTRASRVSLLVVVRP